LRLCLWRRRLDGRIDVSPRWSREILRSGALAAGIHPAPLHPQPSGVRLQGGRAETPGTPVSVI